MVQRRCNPPEGLDRGSTSPSEPRTQEKSIALPLSVLPCSAYPQIGMAPPASDLHRAWFWRTGDPEGPFYIGSEQIRVKKVKATVVVKRSGDNRLGIYKSTTGMLFFETPFCGAGGLSQAGILRAIESQYKEEQIQGSNLNILERGNETLIDSMDDFSKTRKERNLARVACFFEQKPSKVGAIYKEPRLQVSELSLL